MAAACRSLVKKLGLEVDGILSEDGDEFLIARCHDGRRRPLVLKWVGESARKARERLDKEAWLVQRLSARHRLRFLGYQAHGPGYLLTDFDPGAPLNMETLAAGRVADHVADALAEFQDIPREAIRPRVSRTFLPGYYLKGVVKHTLHLWPVHMTAGQVCQTLRIVLRSLVAMTSVRVLAHGDFLPSNVLHHVEDGTVTVTDLEQVGTNHPLFDVLALATSGTGDITEWSWQRRFLHRYLDGASVWPTGRRSRRLLTAYRGILVFFMVYRLSEARINALHTTYFDGHSKSAFLRRRIVDLVRWRGRHPDEVSIATALGIRRRNLACVLSAAGYRAHLQSVGLS